MKKRMHILFDASPMLVNRTGVGYYTERLVSNLAQQYPDDIMLTGFYYNFLRRRDSSHMPTLPNLAYRPVSFIPSKIIFQLRRWGIEIPVELLSRKRVDFTLFPNFLGYPSLFGTPSAAVIHDLTYIDLPDYVAAKNRSDLTRYVPRQIKRSKFVITVSEFSKKRICEEYSLEPEKVIVTPIPPETPVIYKEKERTETLAQLGITKPFLLFLGTIEPRKNVLQLIAAYEQLPEALRSQFQLVIAGRIGWNCEDEETKLAEVAGKGQVVYCNYVDDAARAILFQCAEYFVHASHYEGFGMPLLEAMSYGTPCIVSDIAVFHEVAGDAAQYFDQENVVDIAAAIRKRLTQPEKRPSLSKAARAQAAKFSWKEVAENVYEAITQAITSS